MQVFGMQVFLIVLLVAAAAAVLVLQSRSDSVNTARSRSLAAAEAFAHAPGLPRALRSRDPTAALEPLAEGARKGAGIDFITVTDTRGIRITDPQRGLIGKRSMGDLSRALAGHSFTEIFYGAPSDAVRAVVPVTDAGGHVVGLVAAGIEISNVTDLVSRRLPLFLGTTAAALAVATVGAALVSRRLSRQTHGLGPAEMTRMYEHNDAVLHAVREGVLIIGSDGQVLLANDEARRLLSLPPDAELGRVADLGLGEATERLLTRGEAVTDAVHLTGDRLLAVNMRLIRTRAGLGSRVVTLRDTTELRALTGRAEVARERLQLLYDASGRVGTSLDAVRTAEELAEVAVPRFADFVTVDLTEPVLSGGEPGGAFTTMRRAAVRGVRDSEALDPAGTRIEVEPGTPLAQYLASGEPTLEADLPGTYDWRQQDPAGGLRAVAEGFGSLIRMPLTARGVVLGLVSFWRALERDPYEEDDLSFAEELALRAALSVDNARRFTREHTTAVTLQQSLLPHDLPENRALDVAHRYVPARAGVGGDWFDVIPLPGARVALVIGDVVGHGLHAAVTMGRLRTAVHNFSSLDLSPDEILGHLNDLVHSMDEGNSSLGDGTVVTGATCMYAVYESVSGRCTVASAGHLGPALVDPDGTARFPAVPLGPPLGTASLPFETAVLDLAAGSSLVLYTDGLVEERGRDMDVGLELLRTALEEQAGLDTEPREMCRSVFDALSPSHREDDVALLVARTRLLDPSSVADWELDAEDADPAAVATVRSQAARRLSEWGLDEIAFNTELILSELLTNAVRYGTAPIRVRLLHSATLTCEVADSSSTSPHLKRAAAMDEGGRGLYLVAQFAERWGTRYPPHGKIIWAEQLLTGPQAQPQQWSVDLDDLDDLEGLEGPDP
ncbi:SpoIIE family protein phosphatase [Streptomyces sp. NBC_01023]|uniref:SpoIIE family protein phosphatase n=1 Tax=unclassified Streptomyces TaxID=2593676 RepID=UPI0030DF196E|nr:SpoIIE family protein phosphatase [Streptomyces sp. NBC_01023]